ncbi:MAG: VCBS repeat-containing protein [Verrucomicrobiales bacterium]|nr:VCBS repeat-containing protein [Verrucomicrobiales bacterium]
MKNPFRMKIGSRLATSLRISLTAWCCCGALLRAAELPRFEGKVISTAVKYGYQMVAVDLNADGKKDLLAIDEQSTEVAWLENPSWERHVLAADVPRPLNAACWDIDGDGIPEVALAYRFEPRPDKSIGNVALFTHGADVRQPWTSREIDRVPTAHRIRWMDAEGDGKKVLLLGPMVGKSFPPAEGETVPIYRYRPGTWQRETITSEPLGVLHAINPVDWDGSRRQHLLTASYSGLHRLELSNGRWNISRLTAGDPRPWPLCGSSEVRLGRVGTRRIMIAIEPWHGNQVVVYLPEGDSWKRVVIEDGMDNGHGLAVGDLDGDGQDEIVSGFRGKGFRLSIYQAADARGESWRKTVLDDGGMAAADCVIEDFNGDGKPDIACIGASTGNVKLYVNVGRRPSP